MGCTSLKNPVVAVAMERFVHPFGIRCDYAICDPITCQTPNMAVLDLVNPRWSREEIDFDLVGIFPAEDIRSLVTITVDQAGYLHVEVGPTATRDQIKSLDVFDEGKQLISLNQKAVRALPFFIHKAFLLACTEEAIPKDSSDFLESPWDFARGIFNRKN